MSKTTQIKASPFIEHVHEFRMRLMVVLFFVVLFSGVAYSFNEQILYLLQKPLGQTLYFSSPTGGFSFLFKMCAVAGLIMALPVALYNVFAFLGPLIRKRQRLTILKYAIWSFIMAYAGILFAYFISLPAALHFLT